ncbi:uncharacterized protein LOC133778393 [Humulus lupulus]|uniref:uncharacterized protein LOC133778393 n=1 Tax=Humulus lupulus TaxID=3486 RepID=UPI002B40047B|nr:uncharacterized protein LOC133778393 [Humulus lupulus]XP_062074278.1 uncharacterized protein LOC133778393 [Humulus lupulus]XP_062074279.1 uncharacterized protein LOC133778393 [Humulus lupulus]XP_062074281.1 uncharacterized protein LOC133778393 [Humulus lupulus]XP_062074282.1 uncharacterized protein LOC133778393 [Humulus lupulus]XP_062074283.1 uncharacterized protein LOC133778393 [Humulus lupulus]
MDMPQDPSRWWASVTSLCIQGVDENEDAYISDSDVNSLCSDEDECDRKRSKKEYNPRTAEFITFKFCLGMEFATVEQLRHALKEYFISNDREFVYVMNDQLRVRAKCRGKGCPWVLYARQQKGVDNKSFRVNTLVDRHECGIVFNNRLVDSTWLGNHFLEQFRMNPSMSFKCFKEMTSKGKYANTTSDAFYRAKKVATEILEGSVKEQYAILEDYCNQIRATNPGSTAILKTRMEGDKRYFERVYICLQACKEGFNRGCRPLIGVDGCFLKGYCKGMLLAAIGIDAVNAMFPIAYAVVEKENKSSWTWFLELVKEDLQIQNPHSFCMLSDRQKGLEKALEKLFEGAEIRFCVRHLHANFKKDYPGLLLKQMLWAAARATTKEEWRRRMYDFKQISEPAYTWLSNKAPTELTESHFKEHVKCDMLCNNLCESFNAAIIGVRDKTIIILLEKIRYWLMRIFCTKRESVKKWVHPVGKRILDIIEKNKKVARRCLPTMSTLTTFEVNFMNIEVFVVDLYKRTCACRSFQLNGIPCGHALACIWFSNLDVMNFIDGFYKKVAFEATYSGAIQPMSSPDK